MRQRLPVSLCPSFSVSVYPFTWYLCISGNICLLSLCCIVTLIHGYCWVLVVPTLWFQLSFLPHLNLHKSIGKEERPQLCLNVAIYTCLTQNLGRLRFRLLGGWGTPHAYCARCVSKGMREVIVSGMLDVSLGDLSIAEGDVLHGLWFA